MLRRIHNLIEFTDVFDKKIILHAKEIESIVVDKRECIHIFTIGGRQFMLSKKEYNSIEEAIKALFFKIVNEL